jgi:hypothetical protein
MCVTVAAVRMGFCGEYLVEIERSIFVVIFPDEDCIFGVLVIFLACGAEQ